jgi:hypothetical protein
MAVALHSSALILTIIKAVNVGKMIFVLSLQESLYAPSLFVSENRLSNLTLKTKSMSVKASLKLFH